MTDLASELCYILIENDLPSVVLYHSQQARSQGGGVVRWVPPRQAKMVRVVC